MADLVKESKKEKRERKREKKEKKDKKETTGTVEDDTGVTEFVEVEKSEVSSQSEEPQDVEDAESKKETQEGSDKTNGTSGKENEDEIEIDLNAAVPLSRKRQRLLKKGKLDLDKIARKHPAPRALTEDGEEPASKSAKSPYGVWIGNLSFETTREDIIKHIVSNTKSNDGTEKLVVKEKDISRVNLPKKNGKIKGFAYVDLPSPQHVASVVAVSEKLLNSRNLLIKDASSFEGRPEEHGNKALSKNPPSRILFVGNLSFDTTEDLLEEHFKHCGKIVKIRMATFEDSGKCKGFAFVDFLREEGATNALKSKLTRNFINRPLRLEYGEDRSQRNPRRQQKITEGENATNRVERDDTSKPTYRERPSSIEMPSERPAPRTQKRPAERTFDSGNKRIKSSVALATAQRASAAIVPSQGTKKTFD